MLEVIYNMEVHLDYRYQDLCSIEIYKDLIFDNSYDNI